MKTFFHYITILTFFLCPPIIQPQSDDFLDLTKAKKIVSEKSSGGNGHGRGASGGSHSQAKPQVPLRITLLGLDRQSYQIGDTAIFEIRLENVTKNTIFIPWSADHRKVQPDENQTPPNYIVSSVFLAFQDGAYGEQIFVAEGIYGSSLMPGSLKALEPGQSVRIRAPALLSLIVADAGQRLFERLPLKIEVRAKYSFLEGPYYDPMISENGIPIELSKRSG